jgi:Cu-Zn family superoxide dismutase
MRASGLLFVLVAAGCTNAGSAASSSSSATPSMSAGSVDAVMHDQAGHELGTLSVSESGQGFIVSGSLAHLAPGIHGIHLHTTGACEGNFTSAGAHWNPTGRQHGFENPMGAHLGDLQNIVVGTDSVAEVAVNNRGGFLRGVGGLLDGDGASVIIHTGPDDYRTDPSGNSGSRFACGVLH